MTGFPRAAVAGALCLMTWIATGAGAVGLLASRDHAGARSSLPGIYLVDDSGTALPGPARSIAERILAAARAHDAGDIDALMKDATPASIHAQNVILAEPGVYAQVVKVLTETHGAPTDGETWPGFTMAAGHGTFDAQDERAMGVPSYSAYRGVRILVSESFPGDVWNFAEITAPTVPLAGSTTGTTGNTWEFAFGDRSTVKFTNFGYTADGSGYLKDMHWAAWSASSARGSGLSEMNNCTPSCAGGTWLTRPVRVLLSDPLHVSCGTIYTRAVFYQTESTALDSPLVSTHPLAVYATMDNSAQLCS
jgi:hypothetical protein